MGTLLLPASQALYPMSPSNGVEQQGCPSLHFANPLHKALWFSQGW